MFLKFCHGVLDGDFGGFEVEVQLLDDVAEVSVQCVTVDGAVLEGQFDYSCELGPGLVLVRGTLGGLWFLLFWIVLGHALFLLLDLLRVI